MACTPAAEKKVEAQLHGAVAALIITCDWSADDVRECVEKAIEEGLEDKREGARQREG